MVFFVVSIVGEANILQPLKQMTMYITTQQSLSEVIQENLVNGRLSIRAVARLLDVADKSLVNGGSLNSQKLAQILTEQGFDTGSLIENGFCAKSFWLTLEYFAYDSKAKAAGAKRLARTFGQLGVMTAFDKLEAKPEPIARQLPPVRDYIEHLEAAKEIDNLLKQACYEHLGATNALPVSDGDDLVLAAVLARDLGYKLEKGQDSQLGKWVVKHHEPRGKTQHGRYEVNVYSRREIIDTVHAFFR
jgi:hypothetical protein